MSATRFARLAVAATVAIAGVLLGSGSSGAHSDQGLIKLRAEPSDPASTVVVRAELAYANDLGAASSATVSVEAIGPDGATMPAAPLESEGGGNYRTTLTLPAAGRWTLRVTSATPAAIGEVVFDNPRRAPTAPTPATIDVGDAPATTERALDTRVAQSEDGGGPNRWLIIAAVGVVVAVLVGAAVGLQLVRTRP